MGVFNNVLSINVCLFAVVKYAFRRFATIDNLCQNTIFQLVISTLCLPLTVILFSLFAIVLLPFAIYKQIVRLILQLCHKENFGGMLESADNIWLLENNATANILNGCFLIKYKNSERNMTEFVKNLSRTRFLKWKRLTSLRKSFMGYGYLLCNQLTVTDVVTPLNLTTSTVCDKTALRLFMQKCYRRPLPKNNTAAFEIIVGQQPVDFGYRDIDGEQYLMLLRIHHSVCDGITLFSKLLQDFADEGIESFQISNPTHKANSLKLGWKEKMGVLFNSQAHLITPFLKKDETVLNVPVLSGDTILAFNIESRPNIINKIKQIKNSVPNSSFNDVLYTGFSASLSNYFKKLSLTVPKDLAFTFMVIVDKKNLHPKHNALRNIFSMGTIRLPINIEHDDILERYTRIIEESTKFRNSCDARIVDWQLKTIGNVLPKPLLDLVITLNDKATVSVSTLPPLRKFHIRGQLLNYMFGWTPTFSTVGMGFLAFVYDDKFQLTLAVDKNIIQNEEHLQEVVDDVYISIEDLYEKSLKNLTVPVV